MRAALEERLELARWDAASASEQDALAAEVGERLGPGYALLGLELYTAADAAHRIARFRHLETAEELHLIPGGARRVYDGFIAEDEAQRRVPAFLIGRRLISQATWDAVGGVDARRFEGPQRPIDGLWRAAAEDWLAKVGDGWRLPTEAEWEHAAWGGTAMRFPFGPGPVLEAQWCDRNSGGETHPVSAHDDAPNAFGLVDAVGHLWQLCAEGHASGGAYDAFPWAFDLAMAGPKPGASEPVGLRVAASWPR